MKLFGFYIYRDDWKSMHYMQKTDSLHWFDMCKKRLSYIKELELELKKYKRPRDKNGRFMKE